MIQVRKAAERGHADHGWLNTYYTFSFADYYHARHMGFRALRVMNEDRVQPGQGFGMHGHRDMEIVTYVLSGNLQHKDSMGNGSAIRAGELQRMTAGTGVRHSEFNDSPAESVHLYQIWLLPERNGLKPEYEQRRFSEADKQGKFCLVASPEGKDGSLTIHQDARIYLANVEEGTALNHVLQPGRYAWLQILRGKVTLNGHTLSAGDGAAISEERGLEVAGQEDSELMLFDLA
jgi:redox-sensitive bicupin YhaK (pirin superfamily)